MTDFFHRSDTGILLHCYEVRATKVDLLFMDRYGLQKMRDFYTKVLCVGAHLLLQYFQLVRVSVSFLMALQHNIGYLVPYK